MYIKMKTLIAIIVFFIFIVLWTLMDINPILYTKTTGFNNFSTMIGTFGPVDY